MNFIRMEVFGEAALVGGCLAVLGWLASSKFRSPLIEHFIAGAILHLGMEIFKFHHSMAHKILEYEKSSPGYHV